MLSANLWADTENVCVIDLRPDGGILPEHLAHIKESCERDDIFEIRYLISRFVNPQMSMWCRYDRNVNAIKLEGTLFSHLTCVLNDNEPRERIPD